MGTIWVKEFTAGVDARRMPETTAPGFLIRGLDGHINRGGDFEQRGAFVLKDVLPAGTVGLAADGIGLTVFGSNPVPVGLPAAYDYQQLVFGSRLLERILSWDLYGDKIYAVARYDDDARMHFYDETLIAAWNPHPDGLAAGDFVQTYETKAYTLSGTSVVFSAVDDVTDLDGTGAGFIDMAKVASGIKRLVALAPYQNWLALFAPGVTVIEFFDPDPALNRKVQVLNNIGTDDPQSVTPFGDQDLFFLDSSGVRSLRARDASNAASTTDVGVFVDNLIQAKRLALAPERRGRAIGLVEPSTKNFWMIIGDEIYVYAYFAGSKVSAWTVYRPGFVIDEALVLNNRVYVRSGDLVYVYGGEGDTFEYDATECEIWLPYLDAGKPAQKKEWTGIDLACTGDWEVRAAMEPTNLNASDELATANGTTYNLDAVPFGHSSTHISVRLNSAAPGYKKVSSVVIHYSPTDDEK